MRERHASIIVGTLSVAGFVLIWEAASRAGWLNPVLVPRPSLIFETLADIIQSGTILAPLAHTLALFAIGYVAAAVIGIVLGLAMGTSQTLYGALEPLVELVRPIPKPALVPALFLFLGIGAKTMVAIVILAGVFPILINTLAGVRGIDPVLVDTARTFRLSRLKTVTSVILPAALPMILAGMRVALGLALVLTILAEMLAGESGLGFLILDLQRSFQIRDMYAWIVVLALLGGGLTLAFDAADRFVVPWRGRN